MLRKTLLVAAALCALLPRCGSAQTPTDLAVLKGLAPVSVLLRTDEGKAALAANYTVTGGIQTGAIRQSTLLPFPVQQQQALYDAAITSGNLQQLADGLGTALGAAYVARAHAIDQKNSTSIAKSVANLIAYANGITSANSTSGKFFFANATTDGKAPVSAEALAILKQNSGTTDVFGKAYGLAAGVPGADAYGDSRPFQTELSVLPIVGPDFYNVPSNNTVQNRGPAMNLIDSPSYPSGHTTYGYTGALLLAILVPERYREMIVRGAEYGNDRIIIGAHYAMDVLGGRTLAMYDMAHLLANDRGYMGLTVKKAPAIGDFQAAVKAARADVTAALEAACGKKIQECAHEDTGRLSNAAADEAFYLETQTYNLPVVYPKNKAAEDVGKLAPEAGYLLTAAFPALTLEQANRILTETEGPGGGFLDDGSPFGVYSRLNLYAAAGRAAEMVRQSDASR
jgi:membrane-associated phospholipid phosphatase